jgi:hypothetical protein
MFFLQTIRDQFIDHFGDRFGGRGRVSQLRNRRAGLAPVELVMSLPILMAIMALMVVFGTAACWKLRTEVVSRDATMRARWPRWDYMEPRPEEWPDSAGMHVRAGDPIPELADPGINSPVIYGPMSGGIGVNSELLFFGRGVQQGESDIVRKPAMIKAYPPYHFHVDNPVVDGKFQYRQMGLGGNRVRRIPFIYDFPDPPAGLTSAYQSSVSAIEGSPTQIPLRPLDNDDEFLAFRGSAPDFHPRLQRFCDMDVTSVTDGPLQSLLDRVDRLPRRMAMSFIGLYRSELRRDPPLPAAMQSDLESKIEQLEAYLKQLDEDDRAGMASLTPVPDPLP